MLLKEWRQHVCSPGTYITYSRRVNRPVVRRPRRAKNALAARASLVDDAPGHVDADRGIVRKKGNCYGCGAGFQTDVANGAGFVSLAKYEQKVKHRQLNKLLCERCAQLCNGAMIPGVQDLAQRAQIRRAEGQASLLGKLLVTPEQLREQLMEVRSKKAIVVLVVDLLDASATLMGRVRDIAGRNPIILVGTKMDLLPAGCQPKAVVEWLGEAAARKHLNVVSTHLVSNHTAEGICLVTSKICRERKSRDVYVIGAANVGKSAFVRAMLREMSKFESANYDPAAMANGRYLPVESAMPGTTLGVIKLQAFASGGALYDTPGVHLLHRVPHMLAPEEVKLLQPRKRLRPLLPPTPAQIAEEAAAAAAEDDDDDEHSPAGGRGRFAGRSTGTASYHPSDTDPTGRRKQVASATYLWGDLVRVDLINAPPSTAVAFYGPSSMRVFGLPLLEPGARVELAAADDAESADDESASGPTDAADVASSSGRDRPRDRFLVAAGSVEARGGLVPQGFVIKAAGIGRDALAEIAVSGVPGWMTLWAPYAKTDLRLRVSAPRGVEVYLRPPFPCPPPRRAAAGGGDGLSADGDAADELTEEDLRLLQSYGEGLQLGDIQLEDDLFADVAGMEFDDGADDDADEDVGKDVDNADVSVVGSAGASTRVRGHQQRGVVLQARVEDILKASRRQQLLEEQFGSPDDFEELDAAAEDEDDEEEPEQRQAVKQRQPRPAGRRPSAAAGSGRPGRRRLTGFSR